MLRDRGNKKWVSMMLPEHVKLLREYDESHHKQTKPQLDEQQYEQFDEVISEAMAFHTLLTFTLFRRGEQVTISGRIHYIDTFKQSLRVVKEDDRIDIIFLPEIIHIEES